MYVERTSINNNNQISILDRKRSIQMKKFMFQH